MDLNLITVADFKARFYRDFTYGQFPNTVALNFPNESVIQDQDIQNAFDDTKLQFNQGLFGTDDDIRIGYLYLSAHNLCMNIRSSNGGINGTGAFPVASRSVGSVSEAYSIPAAYTDNPQLAIYTQTTYGIKYLEFVLPKIVGNVVSVYGGTSP